MPGIEEPLGGALKALLIGLLLGLDRERTQRGHAGFATLSNLLFMGGTVLVAGGGPLARRVLPAFVGLALVTVALVAFG